MVAGATTIDVFYQGCQGVLPSLSVKLPGLVPNTLHIVGRYTIIMIEWGVRGIGIGVGSESS